MTVRRSRALWRPWFARFCARKAGRNRAPAGALASETARSVDDDTLVMRRATSSARASSETELGEGDFLGVWRLLRRLGSGGMGAVYLAERVDGHFAQQVAVKLVRGRANRDSFAHFSRERQILATLQHPCIARLIDGGATPRGQPYLVMEYVDGVPIDEFCRERALPLAARLRLFVQVCVAVHFAHQHLVVHCDLKPSNVLVRSDGTPVLLDFGIARALDHAPVPPSRGTAIFTPNYASPEQRRGDIVTTASDIHALGLLLFELASGHKARGVARTPLRGDLAVIVARASADRASRRYPSAQALANDVQYFLERRPVQARRQTISYRAACLMRRHWIAVVATAMALLLIGLFTWKLASEQQQLLEAEREVEAQRSMARPLDRPLTDSAAPASRRNPQDAFP